MKIVINDQRKFYRLSVPIDFGYCLISASEFELAKQMFKEGQDLFGKDYGNEIASVTQQVQEEMAMMISPPFFISTPPSFMRFNIRC